MKVINDVTRFFKKQPMFVQVLIAVLVACLVWVLVQCIQRHMREGYTTDSDCTMYYFHMNGCGHCKSFTPEVDKFIQQSKDDGLKCNIQKVEASDSDPKNQERIKAYNVEGYPTVVMTKNDKEVEKYSGERTSEGLMGWVKSLI